MFDKKNFCRKFFLFLVIKTLGPELDPQFFCSSVRLVPSGTGTLDCEILRCGILNFEKGQPWLWNIKMRDSQFRKRPTKYCTETLAVLWIRVHWIRIWIRTLVSSIWSESGSGSRVLITKIEEKNTADFFFFFDQKLLFRYLFLGLHKGHPSYRRSLHPSKKNSLVSLRSLE